MLCLNVVECILPVCSSLTVGIIQLIPLYLAVFLVFPPINSCIPIGKCLRCAIANVLLVPYIVIATWQIFPIIGLWILGIVVVQFSAFVHRILSEQTCCERCLVADIPIPGEDSCRSEVVYYTAVAAMSVLVPPIRIVLVVINQPINFVGACSLRCAFSRIAPCREAKRVPIVPFLLDTEEVRERIVECSFYIAAVRPSIGNVGCKCPAFAVETTTVSVHSS